MCKNSTLPLQFFLIISIVLFHIFPSLPHTTFPPVLALLGSNKYSPLVHSCTFMFPCCLVEVQYLRCIKGPGKHLKMFLFLTKTLLHPTSSSRQSHQPPARFITELIAIVYSEGDMNWADHLGWTLRLNTWADNCGGQVASRLHATGMHHLCYHPCNIYAVYCYIYDKKYWIQHNVRLWAPAEWDKSRRLPPPWGKNVHVGALFSLGRPFLGLPLLEKFLRTPMCETLYITLNWIKFMDELVKYFLFLYERVVIVVISVLIILNIMLWLLYNIYF